MSMIYDNAIKIASDYLGPAAKRFIDRQIVAHLSKANPEDLNENDIPKFVEWVRVSLSLLTEDQSIIDECVKRIKSLVKSANEGGGGLVPDFRAKA